MIEGRICYCFYASEVSCQVTQVTKEVFLMGHRKVIREDECKPSLEFATQSCKK